MDLSSIFVRKLDRGWVYTRKMGEGESIYDRIKETPGPFTHMVCMQEDVLFRRNVLPRMGRNARERQDNLRQPLETEKFWLHPATCDDALDVR